MARGVVDKEEITRLIKAAPGTEYEPEATNESRESLLRKEMASNLLPRDTRARFRGKSNLNGIVSFLEMGTLMRASWKDCDEFSVVIFRELAEYGRELYRQRLYVFHEAKKSMGSDNKKKQSNGARAPKSKKPMKKRALNEVSSDDDNGIDSQAVSQINKIKYHPRPKLCSPVSDTTTSSSTHSSSIISPSTSSAFSSPNNSNTIALMQMGASRRVSDISSAFSRRSSDLSAISAHAFSRRSSDLSFTMRRTSDAPLPSLNSMPDNNHGYDRLKVLEEQLATERLRLLVQELENALARSQYADSQLRSHMVGPGTTAPSSCLPGIPFAAATASPPVSSQATNSSDALAMLSRMAANRASQSSIARDVEERRSSLLGSYMN